MTTITYEKGQIETVFNKLATILTDAEMLKRNVDYRLDGRAERIGQAANAVADIMRAGRASDGTPPLVDRVAA